MGNVISETGILKINTDLGKYILNWALNDYNPNPKDPNQIALKNSLKKRACCTKQTFIPMAFPDIDSKLDKIILSSVKIPIFKTDQDINDTNCTMLINSSSDPINYKYTSGTSTGGIYSTSEGCANIYGTLCKTIRNNRASVGDTEMEQLYGRNPDDIDPSNLLLNNPYIDCNCQNSWYNIQPASVLGGLDREVLVQNNDSRCSTPANKTYKVINKIATSICFNSMNIGGNITAKDKAALNMDQKCNISSTTAGSASITGGMIIPPQTTTIPAVTTPAVTTPAVTKSAVTTPPTKLAVTTPPTKSAVTTPPTKSAITTRAPTKSVATRAPTKSVATRAPTKSAVKTQAPMNYVLIGGITAGVIIFIIIIIVLMSGSDKSKSRKRHNDDDDNDE